MHMGSVTMKILTASEQNLVKTPIYKYVNFSPTKSLATYRHRCIWEAQQNLTVLSEIWSKCKIFALRKS